LSFTVADSLLVAITRDGKIYFWRTDTWKLAASVQPSEQVLFGNGAMHPREPLLATVGKNDKIIDLWRVDIHALLAQPPVDTVHYINAKVVLLGDTGVGKSGLALALTGQPFVPTDSTHGRRVWMLERKEVSHDDSKETREILLWDLAGQPGYR